MNEASPGPTSRGECVWWEAIPAGAAIPVALVRVELTEPALPAEALPDEPALRRRTRYVAGIEYLARALGAAQPLSWEGDAVTLVLGGRPAAELPGAAYVAAQEIWQRMRLDLEMGARIAAHVVVVAWGPEGLASQAVGSRALLDLARPGMIAASEDVALGLPDEARRDLSPLGMAAGAPAYGFPKEEVPPGERSQSPEDEALWGALRAHARSAEIRILRYPGLRLGQRPPRLDVRDVFVAPTLEVLPPGRGGHGGPSKLSRGARARAGRAKLSCHQGLKEVLAEHRRLILLGDPGSGKSTLLRWLAVVASGGRFACAAELGIPERLLPVLVSLGRLAEVIRDGDEQDPCALLARYLAERGLGDATMVAAGLTRALREGRCLVLLDGLDEAEAEGRAALRRWIEALADAYPRGRLIVTSRIVGYPGVMLRDSAEAILQPFGEAQVEHTARALLAAVARWEAGSTTEIEDVDADTGALLGAVRSIPGLRHLAGNPLGLSTLTLIHRVEGSLPRHRVQAYEVFARTLCETWGEARRVVEREGPAAKIAYQEEGVPVFGQLALAMHERYADGLAAEAFVRRTVARALAEHRGLASGDAERAAEEFLKRARDDTQILAERGPGIWGFLHLSFQELFAAAGLHAVERFEEVALRRLFDPRWQEVLRLGVSYLVLIQRRSVAARRFVERVIAWREPGPRSWITEILRLQIPLATLLAAEAGDAVPGPMRDRIAEEFAAWVLAPPVEAAAERYLEEVSSTEIYPHVARALAQRIEGEGLRPLRLEGHDRLAERILRHAAMGCREAMERLLLSDDAAVRADAVYGLVRAAEDPSPSIRWAFDGQPAAVRSEAMKALVDQALDGFDPLPFRALVLAAAQDASAEVRTAAVFVLGDILFVHPDEPETAAKLEELAREDEDSDVRGNAAFWLVLSRGDARDASIALNLIADAALRARLRSDLIDGLKGLAADCSHIAHLIEQWWLAAMRSSDERKRSAALQLPMPRSEEAVELVIAALNDPSPKVRESALAALPSKESVTLRQRREIERRVRAALDDDAPEMRSAALAAGAAGWLRRAPLRDALIKALQDSDAGVRGAAVRMLPELRRTQRVNDALVRALADVDEGVAWEAADALADDPFTTGAIPRLVALGPRSPAARHVLWTLAMNAGEGSSHDA